MKTNIKNIEFNYLALVHGGSGRCKCYHYKSAEAFASFQTVGSESCEKHCCGRFRAQTWSYSDKNEKTAGECNNENLQKPIHYALIQKASYF